VNWIGRVDVYLLGLLLAYGTTIFFNISSRYRFEIDSPNRAKLVVDLKRALGSLKSIAIAAPYLGLLGACFVISGIFRPIAMEIHAARAMMISIVAAALVTTAAGIFVAVIGIAPPTPNLKRTTGPSC
jgi:biopolymer transport protein ExbB/TolQ